MADMSDFALGSGYGVWNNVAPGQGFLGLVGFGPGKTSESSGNVQQMNDGKVTTDTFGTSTNGSIKEVVAADKEDIVNLEGKWDSKGYTVDPTTGMAGQLYSNTQGDQYLVTGDATVNTDAPAA
jgi:hypothetical protein